MKRKGFTLIELLAVLVLLAILALISIPITIRIINQSRENSYKRSIASYGKAFELAVAKDSMEDALDNYKPLREYNIEDMYSGNRVKCDLEHSSIENGKLNLVGCMVVKEIKNNYDINDNIANHSYQYQNGNVIVEKDYKEYSIGDTFTLNEDSYHIIKNSSKKSDYVVALKDTPLTVAEVTAAGVTVDEAIGDGSIGRIVYDPLSSDYTTSVAKLVVDSWATSKFTNSELKTVNNYTARLLNIDEVVNFGYKIYEHGTSYYAAVNANIPTWLYNSNYWYWIMPSSSSSNVWRVQPDGSLNDMSVNRYNSGAVRPVINVYKSAIEG